MTDKAVLSHQFPDSMFSMLMYLSAKVNIFKAKLIIFLLDLTQAKFFYSENRRPLYMHLQQNGNFVASAANTDFNFETTSISAVLRLEKYDKVWV